MSIPEDDFTELDAIIAEGEERRQADNARKAASRRVKDRRLTEEEQLIALAEQRRLEDLYIWQPIANVALFKIQKCITCTHPHTFFQGWMILQQHRSDSNCRRYIAGKSGVLPSRTEYHDAGSVELCSDCVEACIIIDNAMK